MKKETDIILLYFVTFYEKWKYLLWKSFTFFRFEYRFHKVYTLFLGLFLLRKY